MSELLIEILSEEIPARFQEKARLCFSEILHKNLFGEGLLENSEELSFVSPRRLIYKANVKTTVTKLASEKKGPRVDGNENAVKGFIQSVGAKSTNDLEVRTIKDFEYYFYVQKESTIDTQSVIAQIILASLKEMAGKWANTMRWSDGDTERKWVRPISSILCIIDGKVIEFEFCNVTSSNKTTGHRFLGSGTEIFIESFADYQKKMQEEFVVFDQKQRLEIIGNTVKDLAKQLKCTTLDGDMNETIPTSIISEAVGNNEYPVVLQAKIPEQFMSLPDKVLVNTIKKHQKYFCLLDINNVVSQHFIFVANLDDKNGNHNIIAGNEKVAAARLSDAKFYIDEDLKMSLEDRAKKLKKIILHQKLGSVYEKAERITSLSKVVSIWVPHTDILLAEKTAWLSKMDLTTSAVAEMPDLQGFIGSYYAKIKGQKEEISTGIAEHYKPVGKQDSLPQTPVGITVSVADKLDTIVGLFMVGEAPTSSSDPFALRRSALGIIRIALEHNLNIPVKIAVDSAMKKYTGKVSKLCKNKNETKQDILKFFLDRFAILMKDDFEYQQDIIVSVISVNELKGNKFDYDFLKLQTQINQVSNFVNDTNSHIIKHYKRIENLLGSINKNYAENKHFFAKKVSLKLLKENAEKTLYQKYSKLKPIINSFKKEEKYAEALQEASKLSPFLHDFFENVLVDDESVEIRNNRMRMIYNIMRLFDGIADFSKIISVQN